MPTSREVSRAIHVRSACPLDCPDACSLDVTVDAGRVVDICASPDHAFTAGFICSKVKRFPGHVYAADRILYPALRIGAKGRGEFRRVSWDEALAAIVDRISALRSRGSLASILPLSYGGSNGHLTDRTVDERFFRRLGASHLARTVCAAPTGRAVEGLYGKMPGVALTDIVNARLIVLWGVNPSVTGIHLIPVLKEAWRRGARLVVIDPRSTPLAARADLHIPLRPGSDLAVALSLLRWFFHQGFAATDFLADHAEGVEELARRAAPWTFSRAAEIAGVEPQTIEQLAHMYREAQPAVIRCGWGVERNRNGGSAVCAILALPAVAGKFGVRGGGFTMSHAAAWSLNREAAIATPPSQSRTINMNRLGRALTAANPPVELLFVYNANPLMTLPEQERVRAGLEREDLFTVVFDAVRTDTACYADVLLPATTFLEHTELRPGYGSPALQLAPAAIEPVGESRPNPAVFAELCRRLELSRDGDPNTEEELISALLRAVPHGDRVRSACETQGITFPYPESDPPIPFVDAFPRTPNRKIRLVPAELDQEAGGLYTYRDLPADSAAPLTLISPATHRTISSTLGELWKATASLEISSLDAADRDLHAGDEVRVYNALGEVRVPVKITGKIRPGVVFLPKGLWARHTHNGRTANALAPDSLTDLGGGACFNDARVEVEKVRE